MSDQSGIPVGLLQQRAAKPIDPEQLELMGKRAAALYCSGKPLSDSVVEIVKEARLSPEQVKRVCEFANTSAYLSAFEKSGEVRNVTFDGGPADPGKVLLDLNSGSHPTLNQVESTDYAPPGGHYKTAGVNDSMLAEAFGAGMEKAASAGDPVYDHFARANPAHEVNDLRVRLEGTREHFMSKLSSSGILFDDVKGDLCSVVDQAVTNGSCSLGDVARAWSSYTPTSNLLKEAMVLVGDHLKSGGMSQDELGSSLTKTAQQGIIPNPNHPLVERFIAFTKVAQEHRKLVRAVEVVDEQLADTKHQLGGLVA
jgi:hypothetical protein